MKKLFLYLALTIAFIAAVGIYTKNSNVNFKVTETNNERVVEDEVKTTIDFSDEEIISYSEKEYKGKSAYDLLVKTALENKFEVKVKQYDFGVLVEEIDGRKNSNEKAWIFFINGASAQTASDKYLVNPKDLIEWKYIKPES